MCCIQLHCKIYRLHSSWMNDSRKYGFTMESCQLWTNSSGSSPPTATDCKEGLGVQTTQVHQAGLPTEKPTLATANHSCQAQVSSGTFYHLLHLFAMSSWSLLTLPLSWRSVEEPSWKPMEMFGKSATESVCDVIMLASLSCSKLISRLDILAHVVKTSLVGILARMRSHCIVVTIRHDSKF